MRGKNLNQAAGGSNRTVLTQRSENRVLLEDVDGAAEGSVVLQPVQEGSDSLRQRILQLRNVTLRRRAEPERQEDCGLEPSSTEQNRHRPCWGEVKCSSDSPGRPGWTRRCSFYRSTGRTAARNRTRSEKEFDLIRTSSERTIPHVAAVHEERSVSAQPLSRQVLQVRLRDDGVVQVECPLQVKPRHHHHHHHHHRAQVVLLCPTWSDMLSSL